MFYHGEYSKYAVLHNTTSCTLGHEGGVDKQMYISLQKTSGLFYPNLVISVAIQGLVVYHEYHNYV